ncbi:methyltransferase domain-containing protein [Luteibacter sp. PPL201]|uniref:Methyltransferase domain-containing protein n=1 Tax=Luteibacter sahnii TaxID=3021977 RepID=A0ABT6B763_9GAMM|nr:methyltransferase domain-containing protein [Luteibacter sp. PPL193]MDY1548140.1 methyltransferase domain-containing protein [Luteibacter sp. PPL193]
MTSNPRRQGHATLDLSSRAAKGLKIERLLEPSPPRGGRLLEVGTGAGGIAHYFATRSSYAFEVDAVDVDDRRQVRDGYRFTPVHSTALPFDADTFDVVISNHVIEHVGLQDDQLHHLQEIRRVLKPGGIAYLAVPNRWMPVEPHFRVPLLSWWPRALRSPWLRLWRRGRVYDCEPLTLTALLDLIARANLHGDVASVKAFRAWVAIESPGGILIRALARLPDRWLEHLRALIPTHVCVLHKRPT